MNLLCLFFGHKHVLKFHKEGVWWCWSSGGFDDVCERKGCDFRSELTPEGFKRYQESRCRDPRDPMYNAIRGLLAWTTGGACSDCDPFREAPSCIDFVHHKECAHLEAINEARKLLGQEPEEFHELEDPKSEMHRLTCERWLAVEAERRAKEQG